MGEKALLAECIESKGRKRWDNSVRVLAFLQRIAQAGEHDGPYLLKRWDLMKESCSSHFPLFSTVTGYFFLATLCVFVRAVMRLSLRHLKKTVL